MPPSSTAGVIAAGGERGNKEEVSLRKFVDDIRRWVRRVSSDDWIAIRPRAPAPPSVQSFRSRNAIYRRGATSTLYDPKDFSSYEGVLSRRVPGCGSTRR